MNPKMPTKNELARKTQKQMATFSRHACFASSSSFLMHASGKQHVMQRLKLYHHMARLFGSDSLTGTGRAFFEDL